jgi:predicted nucleic acid-binding protein
MRVVDTSACFEWPSDTALGRNVGSAPEGSEGIVPKIVQFELSRCLARAVSEEAADQTDAFSAQSVVTPLDTRLAVRAAQPKKNHALPMADAIISATAVEKDADVLTCDAHFADLPRVAYFPKAPK